jgi:hypothetical protein
MLVRLMLIAVVATAAWAQDAPSKLHHAGEDRIEGEYLVVLKSDLPGAVPDVVAELAVEHAATVEVIWIHAVKGFFARMTEERAETLSRHPFVEFVEENAPWQFSGTQQTNISPANCDPLSGTCPTTADNRLWHLDRADQNIAAPTQRYSYKSDGTGVTVYVVDTGVNKFHNEFGGMRVEPGFNASGDNIPADDPCLGFAIPPGVSARELDNYRQEMLYGGHGTAVASMVGGRRVGIAKNVTIVPVKVARCDLYSSRVYQPGAFYRQHATMIRLTATGGIEALYQALNAGNASGTPPAIWPTTVGATIQDNQVEWKVIDKNASGQTTRMLIDGLEWILDPENPNPKTNAIVTLSMYRLVHTNNLEVVGASGTLEAAVRALLASRITVIASANNQNGNACHTSPGRMSINNPTTDTTVPNDVITVGGSMLLNRPWSMNLSDITDTESAEADGGGKGLEVAYQPLVGVRDARWICGAGDSSIECKNPTPIATPNPAGSVTTYNNYQGGSNAGPCVTLFAPAKNISVASLGAANSYRDPRLHGAGGEYRSDGHASGTSWAAPIVAGFAARILQGEPTLTPPQVRARLLENSVATLDPATLNTYDYLGNPIPGTPNKLLRLSDVNITAHPQHTAAAPSGSTPLSVVASGTAAVSYQWYEVNAGFDYMTYPRGAHSSTLIAGATGSTYSAAASGVPRAYWVRVNNAWGSADSDIAAVVPGLQAPTGLETVLGANDGVTLTWTAGTGDDYEVQRKIAGQAWTTAGIVAINATTFSETVVAPGGIAVYRVRARKAPAVASSNNAFVNLLSTAYEPRATLPARTTIKAQHLIELRRAVNALCAAVDEPPEYGASALTLSALQGQVVKGSDFMDLMTHINNVRGLPVLALSLGTLAAPSGVITWNVLQALRDMVQ